MEKLYKNRRMTHKFQTRGGENIHGFKNICGFTQSYHRLRR